jgi:hypothetical protein
MVEPFVINRPGAMHIALDTLSSDFLLKRYQHTAGALVEAACLPQQDESCP